MLSITEILCVCLASHTAINATCLTLNTARFALQQQTSSKYRLEILFATQLVLQELSQMLQGTVRTAIPLVSPAKEQLAMIASIAKSLLQQNSISIGLEAMLQLMATAKLSVSKASTSR